MHARLPTVIGACALLIVVACGSDGSEDTPALVANPAAVFCEAKGGAISGPEPMCELPDGTVVDAWEYFRADAERGGSPVDPAADFCADHGGTPYGPEPLCALPDGTVVDAWEHLRTETAGS